MEQTAVQIDHRALLCAICLELQEEPVTLPCGHNYCRVCVQRHWDQQEQSCPQCRRIFRPGPELLTVMAEVVEQLKRSPQCTAEFWKQPILLGIQVKEAGQQKVQQEALSLKRCADEAVIHSGGRFRSIVHIT
ncbi:unnamed protein product [Knipowitschia caucasica]